MKQSLYVYFLLWVMVFLLPLCPLSYECVRERITFNHTLAPVMVIRYPALQAAFHYSKSFASSEIVFTALSGSTLSIVMDGETNKIKEIMRGLESFREQIDKSLYDEIFVLTPDFSLGDKERGTRIARNLYKELRRRYPGKEDDIFTRLKELNSALDHHDENFTLGECAVTKVISWMSQQQAVQGELPRFFIVIDHMDMDSMMAAWCLLFPENLKEDEKRDFIAQATRFGDLEWDETTVLELVSGEQNQAKKWMMAALSITSRIYELRYKGKVTIGERLPAFLSGVDAIISAAMRGEIIDDPQLKKFYNQETNNLLSQWNNPEKFMKPVSDNNEVPFPGIFIKSTQKRLYYSLISAAWLRKYGQPVHVIITHFPDVWKRSNGGVDFSLGRGSPWLDLSGLWPIFGQAEALLKGKSSAGQVPGNWGGRKEVGGSVIINQGGKSIRPLQQGYPGSMLTLDDVARIAAAYCSGIKENDPTDLSQAHQSAAWEAELIVAERLACKTEDPDAGMIVPVPGIFPPADGALIYQSI